MMQETSHVTLPFTGPDIMEEVNRSLQNPKASVHVKKYCDRYDCRYGCLIKPVCNQKECDYFNKIVRKVIPVTASSRATLKQKRGVRYCICGQPLLPRHRMCSSCSDTAKKKTSKQNYRKRKK